jgi:hypothetical protein
VLKGGRVTGATEREESPRHATFRVGVTGHRYVVSTGPAAGVLRDRVRAVFAYLWQTVVDSAPPGSQPVLVVVSPLAEGADRLIAHEAVASGFPLSCPLPFDRDTYERDFTSPHRARNTASCWRGPSRWRNCQVRTPPLVRPGRHTQRWAGSSLSSRIC